MLGGKSFPAHFVAAVDSHFPDDDECQDYDRDAYCSI
jgi:hypothetical protein